VNSRWGQRGQLMWLVFHGLVIVGGVALLVSAPFQANALPALDRPSPVTVRAQSRVTYIDVAATNRLKAQVEAAVPTVYQSNRTAAENSIQQADLLFQNIDGELVNTHHSRAERQVAIAALLRSASISATRFPTLPASDWRRVQHWTVRLLDESLSLPPFDSSQLFNVERFLFNGLPRLMGPSTRQAVSTLVRSFLVPTRTPNLVATGRRQQQAAAGVKAITVTVPAGTIVVRRGQQVTPAVMQELQAVGLPSVGASWNQRLGTVLFTGVVVVLLLWYLRVFNPDATANVRLMFLMDAMILLVAVAGKFALPGHVLLPYFFPVAGATALCGLLLPTEAGVSLAVVLGLILGWVIGGSFELTCYYLLSGVAGALAVRHLRKLNDFILAGAFIGGTAALVLGAFVLLAGGYDGQALRNYAAAAALNGLLSGALAFAGFVMLGNAFGVTTTLHLLELGHPDQPLLRRLMSEAPGTYNHSLILGSMVESAAREIDANALLARVMALYHDIGKMANPLCFIENQMGSANIHDDLLPRESAEIIRGHVTHGVHLARQHRLPASIRDAILQHHGTTTMAYFLNRALQEDPNVDAALFTYPGPKPQTKECGLVMLADGCETAVRASVIHTPETIRDIVNRIIDERVAGGQLAECQLTLRDLDAVRRSFVDALIGMYHPRIEYPAPAPLSIPRDTVGA